MIMRGTYVFKKPGRHRDIPSLPPERISNSERIHIIKTTTPRAVDQTPKPEQTK